MYGSLRDIDLRSLLELIERSQQTGQLLIETSFSSLRRNSCFSVISFQNGQITYAFDNRSPYLQRLHDYLDRYRLTQLPQPLRKTHFRGELAQTFKITPQTLPEYNYLWLLLEQHLLSATQARQIINSMANETLFDLMNLTQGYFVFQAQTILQPQLTQIEISPLLSKLTGQLQQWKELHPYIISPEQSPILAKPTALQKDLTDAAYRSLSEACRKELSLRRIARHLNKDLLTISQALYPYSQKGWLRLSTPSPKTGSSQNLDNQCSKIAWIEEPKQLYTHIDQIEYVCREEGCASVVINDPIESLSVILRENPRLIFCALEMSSLGGEELIYYLRSIPRLSSLPIILLTSQTADPLRLTKAQLLGITEFLPKPFQSSDLSRVIQSYLPTVEKNPYL